jgi:hypothetical protein
MPTRQTRKVTRAPHDAVSFRLAPGDGARLRERAKHYQCKTLSEYVTLLVTGRPLAPMPVDFARLGACVTQALAALNEPTPDVREAARLLYDAQSYGAAVARVWHAECQEARGLDDEPWRATDDGRAPDQRL